MGAYLIRGGTPLRGAVQICGAKNSVLPILAATLATGSQCVLHNCPAISDVDAAVEILRSLGLGYGLERVHALLQAVIAKEIVCSAGGDNQGVVMQRLVLSA